jgi:hypothetical protein
MGEAITRHSLRPLCFDEGGLWTKPGRNAPRERGLTAAFGRPAIDFGKITPEDDFDVTM